MKAIEFLDKMLFEGWDNCNVQMTDKNTASRYNSATDFAQQYAGCGCVLLSDKTMKHGWNPNARYALVWVKNDSCASEDSFFSNAAFISSLDTEETIYFFEIR